jgi:hypothetical protein
MTYPRFLRRRLSAARFFRGLPPPKKGQSRLRWGKVKLTPPFFIQLLILLSLLAALLLLEKALSGDETRGLGVWFIVDTSASMSTKQAGETRMQAVSNQVDSALSRAQNAAKGKDLCFRLSALDLERRDIVEQGDALAIRQALNQLEPRPLGTDLSILHRLIRSLNKPIDGENQCRVSHLVVITDFPAPHWLSESEGIRVVWRDIAAPADNIGLTRIDTVRNPLSGFISEIRVEVTTYGIPPAGARIVVTGPGGDSIKNQPLAWEQNRFWRGSFVPFMPGEYKLQVTNGGAYTYDDTAEIRIGGGQQVRVDWQVRDRRLLRQLGWSQDNAAPQLRVTSRIDSFSDSTVPTLIIGNGYKGTRQTPVEIRDFFETSPLLEDVNLDVVETLNLPGLLLMEGFKSVLRGKNGHVWLAQADNPARAMVPGLPTGGDDVLGRFSATVFFNAVRWLLQKRETSPLYTLTSPQAIEPDINRLALHKDEGNTRRVNRSSGRLSDLKPIAGKGKAKPIWPILVMAAALLFLIERLIAVKSNI